MATQRKSRAKVERGDTGARAQKFGAFGGVFTPSILTILGVIMYLRLPHVVGQAGLWLALGIVLAAHVISVTTGLSVSSIATDKRVKTGGSYFIISRSLGLPIGGTIGIALFVGLSFSVSMYVVGFAESFLTYFHLGIDPTTGDPDPDALRLAGSAALFAVTAITFISTSLAIKTQYFIMAAIALSLVSVLIGNPDLPAPSEPHLDPIPNGTSLIILFGIFFPAVTGFEAGVSMSGDLKNPRKDIPGGTLIAIAVGFVVYAGLCVYLAFRVPADALANDPRILFKVAASVPLLIAGIWGATLSSALGSILGAPRILQACAMDRIGPAFLGRGSGPDNEPRNAVIVAYLIAQGGILIGSLNAIAGIVTMFFLASYGVLNLSCAIESWASPDFRPGFRIPRFVSVIGFTMCIILMMQLDMLAMIGALLVMGGLYVWLKRKELALEGGDTWTGIWSSLARKSLDRLARVQTHHRNWRPNVLLFTRPNASPAAARALGQAMIEQNGVLTEFELADAQDDAPVTAPPEGVFRQRVVSADPVGTIGHIARFHGLAGLAPNTVIVDQALLERVGERGKTLIGELSDIGRNVLLHIGGARTGARDGHSPRIDVWWRGEGRNLALSVSLVRFLTTAKEWLRARVRVHAISGDAGQRRALEQRIGAWLEEMRVTAQVTVHEGAGRDAGELVAAQSADADLVFVDVTAEEASAPTALAESLGDIRCPLLLVRATRDFVEPFPGVDLAARNTRSAPTDARAWLARPETLKLLDDPALARSILGFHDGLAEAFDGYFADGPGAVLATLGGLVTRFEESAAHALEQAERCAAIPQPLRRRRTLARVERGFLRATRQELDRLVTTLSGSQAEVLRASIAALGVRLDDVANELAEAITVPLRDEPRRGWLGGHRATTLRWPLRRHALAVLSAEAPGLVRGSLLQLRGGRERMLASFSALVVWTLSAIERLGRTALAQPADARPEALAEAFGEIRVELTARVSEWRLLDDSVRGDEKKTLASAAQRSAQQVADALTAPGEARAGLRERVVPRAGLDAEALFEELGGLWAMQRHHAVRAALDVGLRELHRHVDELMVQTRAELQWRIERGVLEPLDTFTAELVSLAAALRETPGAPVELKTIGNFELDEGAILQRLTDDLDRDISALPESVTTLSEPSFQALADGRRDDIEEVAIAVKKLVGFILKNDLVGQLREALAVVGAAVARAANGSRDVARLVSFGGTDVMTDADRADLAVDRLALVTGGVERMGAARREVTQSWEVTRDLLAKLATEVMQRTEAGALARARGDLDRFIRTRTKRGFGALGAFAIGIRDRTRRGLVDLSYRWSRGVLLARRLEAYKADPPSVIERVLAIRAASAPSAAVLEALPIFYRQVFIGPAASDPAYWLTRPEDLAAARVAVDIHRGHRGGSLWVTGRADAGIGALARRVTHELFAPGQVFTVRPPDVGSADPDRFRRALCGALDFDGDVDDALATLPEGTAVHIDGLERWWERSPGGLATLELLEGLIERHGTRTLFVVGANLHMTRVLQRLELLVPQALATIESQPLEAQRLRDAILRRHAATGLGLRIVGGPKDREPNELRLARLFTGLFDYSGGYIGAALAGWIGHIAEVGSNSVTLRVPKALDLSPLDDFGSDAIALLATLALHRRVGREGLMRIHQMEGRTEGDSGHELEVLLARLSRAGLITRSHSNNAFELDRFMTGHIVRRLSAREVL